MLILSWTPIQQYMHIKDDGYIVAWYVHPSHKWYARRKIV